ncbi:uncharacterized protein LOC126662091 [Mercurialis annua]|uniref:uncharacterized protein LOC126662091 n=1 Tax=Mercurialis annua TaxID=3986 RepID=UPI002160D825|nr:uncharacterized protein LOC126662091 [Mercurialis annua]
METTFKIYGQSALDITSSVSELIENGRWKENLIQRSFLSKDVEYIQSIPLPQSNLLDKLRWHYDKKGEYSARSGYRLAVRLRDATIRPDNAHKMRWWKYMWNLDMPPKIKIFMWRTFHNLLPVKINMKIRGLSIDTNCPICNEGYETSMHSLWSCPNAKNVWNQWERGRNLTRDRNNHIQDLISHVYETINEADFIFLFLLKWMIWHSRNNTIFGRNQRPK